MTRREYYELNKEHIKAKSRQWSTENEDRRKATSTIYRLTIQEKVLWTAARQRAIKANVPFNIEISDIIIPTHCPYLGIELISGIGKGRGNIHRRYSPSLDRIIPELGYIRGNIQVISWLANTMKSSASKEELILFAKGVINMEKYNG